MAEYPEHEKLSAVKAESQAIGEFIEFGGYTLCKWREEGSNGEPAYVWNGFGLKVIHDAADRDPGYRDRANGYADDNPSYDSWGAGWEAVGRPTNQILADYFEIDLDKIETERRAMLDALRAANA